MSKSAYWRFFYGYNLPMTLFPRLQNKMNRKKKLTQIHKQRLKAARAKGAAKKQSRYISKAERAKLIEAQQDTEQSLDDVSASTP